MSRTESDNVDSGLTFLISQLSSRKISFTPPTDIQFSQLKKAVAGNRNTLGDIKPKQPKAFDLNNTWGVVSSTWEATKSIDKLGRRHLRLIPWILFYPPNDESSWLGRDEYFTAAYLSWLQRFKRVSSIASLLHVFLQSYPLELRTFQIWREGLHKLIYQNDSIRLIRWRKRCQKYFLLDPEGCAKFAGGSLKSDQKVQEIITEAGFTGELVSSGFLKDVQERILRHTENLLREKEIDSQKLEKVIDVLTIDGKTLRFPDLRQASANSLLLPYVSFDPESDIQEIIQGFLLSHFGDPRVSPALWQGVDSSAKEVIFRWLVGATLKDFFRLLDDTAYAEHWKYRKPFWSAYLDDMTDAWVVLGPAARRKANWLYYSGKTKDYGRLPRSATVRSDQSVLLMRIGGITVAEWCHEGKCRLWLRDNQLAPRFYKRSYVRDELVSGADFEQIHYAARYGTWQAQLASWIASQTGIRIF